MGSSLCTHFCTGEQDEQQSIAYGKARYGNEMETEIENWKLKLEQSPVQCFLRGLMSSVLWYFT